MPRVNGSIQRDTATGDLYYLQGANDIEIAKTSDLPTGTDYIQNQSASAQTANYWISGSAIFGTNPASVGVIRLPNAGNVFWRNAANTGDLGIGFNSSNIFLMGGAGLSTGSVTTSTIAINSMVKTNASNTLVAATANTDYLPVSNAALTGTPTAPTASPGTNTTQIATTAFVLANAGAQYWQRSGVVLSPATANDRLSVTESSTSAINVISGTAGGSSSTAIFGQYTGTGSGIGVSGSGGSGYGVSALNSSASTPPITIQNNNAGGPLAEFKQINTVVSSVVNNGGFNWTGATASRASAWDSSKNLVAASTTLTQLNYLSSATGTTGTTSTNLVFSTSPTLVTPVLGVATGTSLALSGAVSATTGGFTSTVTIARSGNQALNLRNGTATDRFQFFVGDGTGGTTADENYIFNNNTDLNITNVGGGVQLVNGATSWSAISDERTKVMSEFKPFPNAAEKVSSLRAGTSRYKTDSEGVSRSFLIAQDVQKVLPEAVSADKNGELSLRYQEVIPLLVAAIKELKAEIETLKNK